MAAREAMQALLSGGLIPADIDKVVVAVPSAFARMISGTSPSIISAPYNLASLAWPKGGDAVAALAARIQVVGDDSLSAYYPERWPARVEVTLTSGETRASTVLETAGDPGRPFDTAAVRGKFISIAAPLIGAAEAEGLAAAALGATLRDDDLKALHRAIEARAPSERVLA
jgi:hypothetical protein